MPLTQHDYKKMVKECLKDESDRLSAWEIEFLDSVHRQDHLSDKQTAAIDRIWNKLFS